MYCFYKLNKGTLIMFLLCYSFPQTIDKYKRKHDKET